MSLTSTGVEEIIFRQHICSWLPSKEIKIKKKKEKTIVSRTIFCCLLQRVARAYQSALGHGTALPYLSARDARLFFVCYATHPFCAQNNRHTCCTCGVRALSPHVITLKFSLVSFLLWTTELFLFCRYTHLTWTLTS